MCKCHQLIKQCRLINEKLKEKTVEERGFTPAKHDTLHLSQWMQKHPKQHHGMQSFPHHGH
jgi:hypothetical protein